MKDKTKGKLLLFICLAVLLGSFVVACSGAWTVYNIPIISFEPPIDCFNFTDEEGGSNLPSQTLGIKNSGAGHLDWEVNSDAEWLCLHPTIGASSGEVDEVTVSVDISGMSAGSYSGTITISAPNASNSPQTVLVELNISPR